MAASQRTPRVPAYLQQVDEREATGDLDIERAAAMRAVIEVSEVPLFLGFGGHGEIRGFDGRRGPQVRGGDDRDQDDESPTGLPGDDEVSNQSASVLVAPAESVAIG